MFLVTETGRRIFDGYTASPTTGTFKRGDIILYSNPVAAGYIGEICVSAGTPGTWKTFGAISA